MLSKLGGLLLLFVGLLISPLGASEEAPFSVQEQHVQLLEAFHAKDWALTEKRARELISLLPSSPFTKEAHYYLGVTYFERQEYARANAALSTYLSQEEAPQFFERVIEYKFQIASRFRDGHRRSLFGWKRMPKLLSGHEFAISLYEEVIASLPRSQMAAEALFYKGQLQIDRKNYSEGVESFQTLIRRFPKNRLAIEGFLAISKSYLSQCKDFFPDPDHLTLARISQRKFRSRFPGEPRLSEGEENIKKIEETLAEDLLQTGNFYQRTKKLEAAQLYYRTVLAKYPNTLASEKARDSLTSTHVDS